MLAAVSAAAVLASAGTDAMFLARWGAGKFGLALLVSSALLVPVLALVGAWLDRGDRGRVLLGLVAAGVVVLVGLVLADRLAPALGAGLGVVLVKQVVATLELAFWVQLGEQLDAGQSARAIPRLAAIGGVGGALGGGLAVAAAAIGGAEACLGAAALLLLGVAALVPAMTGGATRLLGRPSLLGPGRRAASAPAAGVATDAAEPARHQAATSGRWRLAWRGWADGLAMTARLPLAAAMAGLVALGGAFASLMFFALGAAAHAHYVDADALAAFLAGSRAIVGVVAVVVQLVLAPRWLGRLGTGRALQVAPAGAVLAALALAIDPLLAVAVVAQGQAKILDAAVETPAEKMALALLPEAQRGRVGAVIDGAAKRGGAMLGAGLAALLVATPRLLFLVTAVLAAGWWAWAVRLGRRLPALAVAQVTTSAAAAPVVAADRRTLGLLLRELDGPAPDRAAAALAAIHGQRGFDAGPALVRALAGLLEAPATDPAMVLALASAATTVLTVGASAPATGLGPGWAARLEAWPARVGEEVIRVAGLVAARLGAGAPAGPGAEAPAGSVELAEAWAIAAARAGGDDADDLAADLDDGLRAPTQAARVVVLRELVVELRRRGRTEAGRGLARLLVRALRRRRGDDETHAGALVALCAELGHVPGRDPASGDGGAVVDVAARAELALLRAELLAVADAWLDPEATASAGEQAAALMVVAALAARGQVIEPATVARVGAALGARADEVRLAAGQAVRALGRAAVGPLLATASYGRRAARDHAASLLAELPVTRGDLDALIDREAAALAQARAHHTALATLGRPWLPRRLHERADEIAYTVILLWSARTGATALATAARAWRRSVEPRTRARALEVIAGSLRPTRLAATAALLGGGSARVVEVDQAIAAELATGDPLARALLLGALDPATRAAHRALISSAARQAAELAGPEALLRRLSVTDDEGVDDMPTRIETLVVLGKVPLLSALTSRQLADLAAAVTWSELEPGALVVASGEVIDALLIVGDGALVGDDGRRWGPGDVVDELALVAPRPWACAIRAAGPGRLAHLERVAFAELLDDVPGLGPAVCQALGQRLRAR